jgi:glutathione S-transferase
MDTERPSLPNVEAWHERLKQRPGFQKYVMQPLT